MERLREYRRRRDFRRTPEPTGEAHEAVGADSEGFVVHKHAARRLHYDLRLEEGGVLRSWALPKVPSLAPGENLRCRWALARIRGRSPDDGRNWLMIKRRDGRQGRPTPDETSVLSGRTMDEIARGDAPGPGVRGDELPPGARRGSLPTAARLQLATLGAAPEGDGWLHEIKFDGYRIAARLETGSVRLLTRNGHDWTGRFPEIAAALRTLAARRALLDGEVVACGRDGVSSFRDLQEALSTGATAALVYQAFDLLHLDEHDLRGVSQQGRAEALGRLLRAGGAHGRVVRPTEHVVGKGPAFFRQACRLGLEGVVSKRIDATYRAGRSRSWVKSKCTLADEFVVGGYTRPQGSRSAFGALLLGRYEGGALVYQGRVGGGFGERLLRRLHSALRSLERPTSPFEGPVPDARSATWVEPELVVEVGFAERTRDGRLRHPTFRGLRDDAARPEARAPALVLGARDDRGEPRPTGERARAARQRRHGNDDAEVAGVRLTNAHRVLYPEQGITKLALARYYERIQEHVLPALARRPLALVRCPKGHGEACFYQKHPGDAFARSLPRVSIAGKEGQGRYAYVETVADLVGLVQAGVLELHVWGARIEDIERPDLMVLDLDPADDVPWSETRATAFALRDRLEGMGLGAFLRTTGGKGLHIVVPLAGAQGWDEVKAFARAVCEQHAAEDPKRLTTNMSLAKRRGKIFLDYLRNGRGATAIASYSTRARSGAPVAVPLRWDELVGALRSDRYDIESVRRRLAALGGDPWEGIGDAASAITAAMRSAAGLGAAADDARAP